MKKSKCLIESVEELSKAAFSSFSSCYNLENWDFNFKYMGHFRQRIEILSLIFPACAHMKLRSWVHLPNCMVPWPGEQTVQSRVATYSDLELPDLPILVLTCLQWENCPSQKQDLKEKTVSRVFRHLEA
jgi:hypothetical protein